MVWHLKITAKHDPGYGLAYGIVTNLYLGHVLAEEVIVIVTASVK